MKTTATHVREDALWLALTRNPSMSPLQIAERFPEVTPEIAERMLAVLSDLETFQWLEWFPEVRWPEAEDLAASMVRLREPLDADHKPLSRRLSVWLRR